MIKVRYHFLFLIGLCGLILSTESSPVYAQDIPNNSNVQLYWVNGGLGVGSSEFAGGVSLSYQTGKNLISVRYVYNEEWFDLFGPSPKETVWDIGFLYGRSSKAQYGFASISGGIGIIGGVRRGKYLGGGGWLSSEEYEKLTFLTVGLPVEVQLFWTPLSVLGIGIYGFANLNPEQSFVGALLCIQIGKLK